MATYPIGKIGLNLCGAYSETATYQQLYDAESACERLRDCVQH